jgi:uncharacterized C2H2 Zn-finger protein
MIVENMRSNNHGGASKDLINLNKNKKTARRPKSSSASSRVSSEPASAGQSPMMTADAPEDMDVDLILEMTQAISNLIKKPPSRFRSRTSSTSASNAHKCEFPGCDSAFARPCELRKHMKRHTKPYGCTFPSCDKRFGSKSDWKRHEKDQHFQMECYVCQVPRSPKGNGRQRSVDDGDDEDNKDDEGSVPRCSAVFAKEIQLRSHMETEHPSLLARPEDVTSAIKASRVGKNYLGTFYCGFCRRVKILVEKRNKGWAERFDHIDAHFRDRKIEEWICYEAGCAKGDGKGKVESDDDDEADDSIGEEDEVRNGEKMDCDVQSSLKPDTTAPSSCSSPPPPPPPPPPLPAPIILSTSSRNMSMDLKPNTRKRHTYESEDSNSNSPSSHVGSSSHLTSSSNSGGSGSQNNRKRTRMKYFNYCVSLCTSLSYFLFSFLSFQVVRNQVMY